MNLSLRLVKVIYWTLERLCFHGNCQLIVLMVRHPIPAIRFQITLTFSLHFHLCQVNILKIDLDGNLLSHLVQK